MRLRTTLSFTMGLMAVGLASGPPPSDPVTNVDGVDVTTDTPEYCGSLFSQIARMPRRDNVPDSDENVEVNSLAMQGRRLCELGHIRAGLVRLRRALLILQGER